jgi:HK97 family phage portal protein
MGLIDQLLGKLGYAKTPLTPPEGRGLPPWISAYAESEVWNVQDPAYTQEEADLYSKLSWINIAVSLKSKAAAAVNLKIYQDVDGADDTELPNHDFLRLLRHPNPNMSRFEFLEATYSYFSLTGNAYWWLNLVDGRPVEMWVIPSGMMEPLPDEHLYIKGYKFTSNYGAEIPLSVDEVVHFKTFNPKNDFTGISPFKAMQEDIRTDQSMSAWNGKNYSENNGRLPGVLAFKDYVEDREWKKILKEVDANAKRRSIMMIRGAGTGISYLQTTVSQKDMDFINQRTFTKEEIYSLIAPGLSSILSVNATEANAKTGLATFNSMAVWPMLCASGEKITNDLLPLYGEGLKAEHEDIRITDRVLQLDEQAEYAKTHTLDEIRQKYYGDKPLPTRGDLLPAEVTTISKPGPVPVPPPSGGNPPKAPDKNAGKEPVPSQFDIPDDGTTKAPPRPSPNNPAGVFGEGERSERETELGKWRKQATNRIKRGKSADAEFISDAIPENVKEVIHSALKDCQDVESVKAVFDSITGNKAVYQAIEHAFGQASPAEKAELLTTLIPSTWRGYP